jgi:hypothetical protein
MNTPRVGVHEMKPTVFMKPTAGGGDESLTLRHPSKLRDRRPSGRRFLFEADQIRVLRRADITSDALSMPETRLAKSADPSR